MTTPTANPLPKNFLWDTAMCAHQTEGNNVNSDWWLAEHVTPTLMVEPSGDACDSYHRYGEDITIAADLGFNTHRIGIEWARIEPEPGRFSQAALDHYRRVLEAYPDHPRARLFMRDSSASGDLQLDEHEMRQRDRLDQVMGLPVSDFELSVRSRNCLQKMGIQTLGDLARTSEEEILASKNFGETSLIEIKEMLASKGLSLGQIAAPAPAPLAGEPEAFEAVADDQEANNLPITELNLSVRARKCTTKLGITTIGDLVRRTAEDLLECKNFGVTSLNEVREKLTERGLKLRGD